MKFQSDRPIFQQIVDHVEEQVLRGELEAAARVPAVRDYALDLEVNPNTVVRSFLELEQGGVIFKRRGIGYFVSDDAKKRILARRKRDFLDRELPEVVRRMRLMGIGVDAVVALFKTQDSSESL